MSDVFEQLTQDILEAEFELHQLERLRESAPEAYELAEDRVERAHEAFQLAVEGQRMSLTLPWDADTGLVFSERWPIEEVLHADDNVRLLSGDGGTLLLDREGRASASLDADAMPHVAPAEEGRSGLPPGWAVPELRVAPDAPALDEAASSAPIALVTHTPPEAADAHGWNRRRAPHDGETLQGFPIEGSAVTLGGRRYRIHRSGAGWGIMYTSHAGQVALGREIERSARAYIEAGQLYRAAAARAYYIAAGHEGCISAINTYDDQDFTFGTGFSGGRLASMFGRLRHDGLTATALHAVGPYFNEQGGFIATAANRRSIRLDLLAIDKIVQIAESPTGSRELGRSQVDEWIAGSALGGALDAHTEELANEVARTVRIEVIGIAAYCRHGRGAYTPDPPADLRIARRIGGENPSRQIAVLLKLHMQRIADLRVRPAERVAAPQPLAVPEHESRAERRRRERANAAARASYRSLSARIAKRDDMYPKQCSAALTRRMPNKILRFESAMREAGVRGFTFDVSSVQDIIPGLRRPPTQDERVLETWPRPTTTAPENQIYVEYQNLFYSLGARIS